MIKLLLQHQWEKYWRSPNKGQNLFNAILLSFLLLVVAIYAISAGVFLPDLLRKVMPGKSPVLVFNQVILYYFISTFLIRWIFQGIPAQDIDYYRMMPVKRILLIRLLLAKSALNAFNLLAVFFFAAFSFSAVLKEYSFITAMCWLISVLSLELSNSYLVFYLQKKIFSKAGLLIPAFTVLVIFITFEIISSLAIYKISAEIFNAVLSLPVLFIFPLLLLSALYYVNYILLKSHFYPEDLKKRRTKAKSFSKLKVFDKLGELGLYIALEIKMIFRNRRPRSMFYYSLIFLFYPALTYKSFLGGGGVHHVKNLWMIYFWSIFSPSFGMVTYGQNIFSWDGGYFDFICSRVTDIKKYIYAKYCVMVLSALCSFSLLSLYAFIFGAEVFWFNAAGTIYSIGINSVIMLILGPMNKKRFDLSSGMMSQQGRDGWTQFIKGIPIFMLMSLTYLIVKIAGYSEYIFYVITFLGLIAFLFRNKAINIAVTEFEKHRYLMAAGFRQS